MLPPRPTTFEIDLDAALGRGSNAELVRPLLQIAPCRVGGGIRDERGVATIFDNDPAPAGSPVITVTDVATGEGAGT